MPDALARLRAIQGCGDPDESFGLLARHDNALLNAYNCEVCAARLVRGIAAQVEEETIWQCIATVEECYSSETGQAAASRRRLEGIARYARALWALPRQYAGVEEGRTT
jgi:hypothetical protein